MQSSTGHFRDFIKSTGLRNARQGFGVGPTWPALGSVGVPIDHILFSHPLQVKNFQVEGGIGSDHFPISAHLVLAADPSTIHSNASTEQ